MNSTHSLKIDTEPQAEKPAVAVVLTGTAAGRVGTRLGTVDIGESERAYLFRVALPGVNRHDSNLKCDIQAVGKVHIEGVVSDSHPPLLNDMGACKMLLQQLSPSGPFTVAFNLPGPVDPRLCSFEFSPDGILEVVVTKKP